MDRATRKRVEHAFARAFYDRRADTTGGDGQDNRHNIGRYALDYYAVGGGYMIKTFLAGDSGMGWAEGEPFDSGRRPAREMIIFLEGFVAGRKLEKGGDRG